MKFWSTNELRFCVIAREEDAQPQHELFREQDMKTTRFILNCTAQDLFAEMISPTQMKETELGYCVYSRPLGKNTQEPTEKLGLHTPSGRVTLDNDVLVCDNAKICEQCFLCGTITLFETCVEHWPWKIPLRKQKEIVDYALVDSEDFESLMNFKWHCTPCGYANCCMKFADKTSNVLMHRFIMKAQKGQIVDHFNRAKIDNRRKNLRFVTRGQNAQNVPLKPGTSKYRGVSYAPSRIKKPWQVMCGGAFLGYYEIEEHAAYAYNCRAIELYGPQARVNNISKPNGYTPRVRRNTAERVVIDGIEAPGLTVHKTSTTLLYELDLKIKGTRFNEKFTDLEEAKKKYLQLKHQLNLPDPNTVIIPRNENGCAILPCKNTSGVIVDDDIYLRFYAQTVGLNTGYPRVSISGKSKYLHRFVCAAEDNTIIDHIDNDKLHCKRVNLRSATPSLNAHNQSKQKGQSSQYIGVSYSGKFKYFEVYATKDGVRHSAGTYKDESVAGFASDCLRTQLWGTSAHLNNVKLDGYEFVNNRAVACQSQPPTKKLKM